jgi:hypothetical protein
MEENIEVEVIEHVAPSGLIYKKTINGTDVPPEMLDLSPSVKVWHDPKGYPGAVVVTWKQAMTAQDLKKILNLTGNKLEYD